MPGSTTPTTPVLPGAEPFDLPGSGPDARTGVHPSDSRIVDLLLAHPEITEETGGVVNMSAPGPIPNRDFLRILRRAWKQPRVSSFDTAIRMQWLPVADCSSWTILFFSDLHYQYSSSRK